MMLPFEFSKGKDGNLSIKLFFITYDKRKSRFDNKYTYSIGIELSKNLFFLMLVWYKERIE